MSDALLLALYKSIPLANHKSTAKEIAISLVFAYLLLSKNLI